MRALVLIVILTCTIPAFAQEAGRITRVILYPGSATVERSARVAGGAGKVEMTGLPANFDLRTLRVEADPGIRIGEVAVQDAGRAEAMGGREGELEGRVQALKDEKAALDVEVKGAELVRDYLAALATRPAADGAKPQTIVVDPKAIPAVIDAIRRGGTGAYGLIQRMEIRKRELDKQIAALEPVYRAGLDSASSRVELERQASVMQRTGEDWRGVSLRLSTGQPRPAQIVDPATWRLVIRPPVELRSKMDNLARAERAAESPPIVA